MEPCLNRDTTGVLLPFFILFSSHHTHVSSFNTYSSAQIGKDRKEISSTLIWPKEHSPPPPPPHTPFWLLLVTLSKLLIIQLRLKNIQLFPLGRADVPKTEQFFIGGWDKDNESISSREEEITLCWHQIIFNNCNQTAVSKRAVHEVSAQAVTTSWGAPRWSRSLGPPWRHWLRRSGHLWLKNRKNPTSWGV